MSYFTSSFTSKCFTSGFMILPMTQRSFSTSRHNPQLNLSLMGTVQSRGIAPTCCAVSEALTGMSGGPGQSYLPAGVIAVLAEKELASLLVMATQGNLCWLLHWDVGLRLRWGRVAWEQPR